MKTRYKLVCGLINRKNKADFYTSLHVYHSIEEARNDIRSFIQGVKGYRAFVAREDIVEIYDDNKLLVEMSATLSRCEDHYYTDIQEDNLIGAIREVPFENWNVYTCIV